MTRLSLTVNEMTSQAAVEWTWNHTGVSVTDDSGTNGLIKQSENRLLFSDFFHSQSGTFLARFGCFLKSGCSQKTWDIIAKMNMSLS